MSKTKKLEARTCVHRVPYSRVPRIKDSIHSYLRNELEKQAEKLKVIIEWESETIEHAEKRTGCVDNFEVIMKVGYK